ncbi:MAG: alginate export family protein [Tannerellaceae bacterium]|jgi:hypothetical protein|nr:alginate export family protein [Tannerellaceae bacterium]
MYRIKDSYFLIACLFLVWAPSLSGQTSVIDGEIRSRTEYRDGFRYPLTVDVKPAMISSLRTRLRFDYTDEKLATSVILQDSRIYGQTGTNDTRNSLGIYEAWGRYALTPDLSITLGRQAIEYDDKRLLTVSNWSHTGSAHDLVLVRYESHLFKLHWGGAWNNSGDDEYDKLYKVTKSYKALSFVWFAKTFGPLNLSAIWIGDGFQQGKTDAVTWKTFRNTVGGNLELADQGIRPFSFYATAYYQFGRDPRNAVLDAHLLALKTSFSPFRQWSLRAGVDYLSGSTSAEISQGRNGTFNKLYGSNNSFNGKMEYWTTPPVQGLFNWYAGIIFHPGRKFDADIIFHSFSVAEPFSATAKKNIGTELDLTARYIISPQLALQGGWSLYFRNRQTALLKEGIFSNVRFPQWGYLMVTLKPRFLNR